MSRTAAGTHVLAAPSVEEPAAAWAEPTRLVIESAERAAEVRARLRGWAEDPARLPGARLVKQGRKRTVVRLPELAPLPAIYVKQERVLGGYERIKSALRRSHARVEYENGLALRAMGVLAPSPICYAEWADGPFLQKTLTAFEELAGAPQVDAFLAPLRDEERKRAIAAVARALASAHARGVDLIDCHRGNLLVFASAEGGIDGLRLAMLDLASVRLRAPDEEDRVRRVGQLIHSLREVLLQSERAELARKYAAAAGLPVTEIGRFECEALEAERAVHEQRERSRDRRCLVDSTEFAVEHSASKRIFRRRDVALDMLVSLAQLGKDERALEADGARILHSEGRNLGFVVEGSDGRGERRRFFVKRTRASSLFGAVVDAVRGSRGRRAWKAAHALARRGVPTPKAYGLIEEGPFVPLSSTLVVELIEGSVTLREIAARFPDLFPLRIARARFLEQLGTAVGKLHSQCVFHDDLATKNVLVQLPKAPGEAARFHFIDLDAVRRVGPAMPRELYLRALMQLDDCPRTVSRVDRLRFLIAYESALGTRFPKSDLVEVRRMLRERFLRSKRDFAKDGPN